LDREGNITPITLDELGKDFTALLGPLGEILEHMRAQNEFSTALLVHSRRLTESMDKNNKRLFFLIMSVSFCSLLLVFVIVRSEMLAKELTHTQYELQTLQRDLISVLELSRSSKEKIDNTSSDLKKVVDESTQQDKDSVTMEQADGGVEVVVRPSVSAGEKDRPVVRIPVTVPNDLKIESEDRKQRSPKK
jgi:hypothetical protein